jgi:hypothetical protein
VDIPVNFLDFAVDFQNSHLSFKLLESHLSPDNKLIEDCPPEHFLHWVKCTDMKRDKIKILERKILKRGIHNLDLANQEGNENIKMYDIKKILNILLYSAVDRVIKW